VQASSVAGTVAGAQTVATTATGGFMSGVGKVAKSVGGWLKTPQGSLLAGNMLTSYATQKREDERFEKSRQFPGAYYGMERDGTTANVAARNAPTNMETPPAPEVPQQMDSPGILAEAPSGVPGSNVANYEEAFPTLSKGLLRA